VRGGGEREKERERGRWRERGRREGSGGRLMTKRRDGGRSQARMWWVTRICDLTCVQILVPRFEMVVSHRKKHCAEAANDTARDCNPHQPQPEGRERGGGSGGGSGGTEEVEAMLEARAAAGIGGVEWRQEGLRARRIATRIGDGDRIIVRIVQQPHGEPRGGGEAAGDVGGNAERIEDERRAVERVGGQPAL